MLDISGGRTERDGQYKAGYGSDDLSA
jgi:hypothetical protein